MKHLRTYNQYKDYDPLMEGWLGDKMKQLSSGAKAALKGFVAPFQSVMKDIKDSWRDGVKAEEIKQKLITTFETSFKEAEKNLADIEDEEEITKLINDMELSITQFSDTVSKTIQSSIKESLVFEGKSDLMAAHAGVKAVLKTMSGAFGKFKEDFVKSVENAKNLQEKKEIAKTELNKMWKGIQKQITDLDIQGLMDEARKKGEMGEDVNDKEYEPGDAVKYTKQDGTENDGTVAHNQKDVEEGMIKLQSADGKDRFVVSKDKILGSGNETEANKESDDLKSKLGKIKGDRKKLKKVSDFMDTL